MGSRRRVAVQREIDQAYKRHTSVFAGIHDYARGQADWRLIVDEWADHTLPPRGSKLAPYDGLIGRISAQGARRARRLRLPVVNVWFNSPARDLPGVFSDHIAAGRLVAEHLLARGFCSFGAVFHAAYRGAMTLTEGFEKAVREAGHDQFRKVVVYSQNEAIGDGYQDWQRDVLALERWLDALQLPVGLSIYEICTARVIIEMFLNRGWRVPEDVAIVAGTNEETIFVTSCIAASPRKFGGFGSSGSGVN